MSIETVTTYTCDLCGEKGTDVLTAFFMKRPATLSTNHPLSYIQVDICDICVRDKSMWTLAQLFLIMNEAEIALMEEPNVIPES
jgi:hypothetical protein